MYLSFTSTLAVTCCNPFHPRHGAGRQRKRVRGSGSTAVMALEVAGTVAQAMLATQQRSGERHG